MDIAQTWIDISMSELSGAPTKSEIEEYVSDVPGIYVWRRELPRFQSGPSSDFELSILHLCQTPSAVIPSSTIASSVILNGINLGQGDLSLTKRDSLSKIVNAPRPRKMLQKHITALERFLLPLYVGSAMKLATRIYQHATGQTDFSRYIEYTLAIDFSTLVVSCLRMPPPKDAERALRTQEYIELLEIIAQRVLAPVGVQRAG